MNFKIPRKDELLCVSWLKRDLALAVDFTSVSILHRRFQT